MGTAHVVSFCEPAWPSGIRGLAGKRKDPGWADLFFLLFLNII